MLDVELEEVELDEVVLVLFEPGHPFNIEPTSNWDQLQLGFVCFRSSRLQPSFEAMPEPVSPGMTVYVAVGAVLVELVDVELIDELVEVNVELIDELVEVDVVEVLLEVEEEFIELDDEVEVFVVLFDGIGVVPLGQLPPGTFKT